MKKFLTKDKNKAISFLKDLPEGEYQISISKPTRTSRQNNALHLYFSIIADALNESGLYFSEDFFKQGFELEWTPEMIKELIWRPIQQKVYNKKSTRDLTTSELSKLADTIGGVLAQKGLEIDFPSIEYLLNR